MIQRSRDLSIDEVRTFDWWSRAVAAGGHALLTLREISSFRGSRGSSSLSSSSSLIPDTLVQTKTKFDPAELNFLLPKFYVFPIQSGFSMWRLFYQNYLSSSFGLCSGIFYSNSLQIFKLKYDRGAALQNSRTCKLEQNYGTSRNVKNRPTKLLLADLKKLVLCDKWVNGFQMVLKSFYCVECV